MKQRAHGEGSVYQRTADGLWVATLPHRSSTSTPKQFTSKVRAIAELKRDVWLKQHDQTLLPDPEAHAREVGQDVFDIIIGRLEPIIEEMVERAIARRQNTQLQ